MAYLQSGSPEIEGVEGVRITMVGPYSGEFSHDEFDGSPNCETLLWLAHLSTAPVTVTFKDREGVLSSRKVVLGRELGMVLQLRVLNAGIEYFHSLGVDKPGGVAAIIAILDNGFHPDGHKILK